LSNSGNNHIFGHSNCFEIAYASTRLIIQGNQNKNILKHSPVTSTRGAGAWSSLSRGISHRTEIYIQIMFRDSHEFILSVGSTLPKGWKYLGVFLSDIRYGVSIRSTRSKLAFPSSTSFQSRHSQPIFAIIDSFCCTSRISLSSQNLSSSRDM
jgi:hypothetical protein